MLTLPWEMMYSTKGARGRLQGPPAVAPRLADIEGSLLMQRA